MIPPHPSCTRLQNFVATLRAHGNEPGDLKIAVLAKHNPWTDADAIKTEFDIQRNGSRKLPEEVAVAAPPVPEYEGGDE